VFVCVCVSVSITHLERMTVTMCGRVLVCGCDCVWVCETLRDSVLVAETDIDREKLVGDNCVWV